MPIAAKYKDDSLIRKLTTLYDLNTEIKNLMHTNVHYYQSKVPSRSQMVSKGKVYTQLKVPTTRLVREEEKKLKDDTPSTRKMRISRIHPKLARFLRLKERGLPTDKYPDSLVMSYFADWVAREGRRDGNNVKLFGRDDPFVLLFKEELSLPGSGPDNEDGPTSVLDKDGNIINPFPRRKHMVVFKNLFVQKRQLQGDTYVTKRESIVGEEYANSLSLYEKERELLTKTLGDSRNRYTKADDKYKALLSKQEEAKSMGDTSVNTLLPQYKKEVDEAMRAYLLLLDQHNLTHKLSVPTPSRPTLTRR